MDQRTTVETIPESHPLHHSRAPLPPPLNAIPNQQISPPGFPNHARRHLEPHPLNALSCATPDQPPANLAALLDHIARRPGVPAVMLRTITAHLARYIGAPATDLKLGVWDAELPGFAAYLVK